MITNTVNRPATPSFRWHTSSLALLAVAIAAVIAWSIRDWSLVLDTGKPPAIMNPSGAGHHGGALGTLAPPPAVLREQAPNLAGIALLAVHATFGGVAASAALARRRVPAGRTTTSVLFAASCSVFAAVSTVPIASLTVGNAISFGNTLAAAITVSQYSFLLALLFAAASALRARSHSGR
ncbi:hypothetical protein GCM10027598_58220 [Amycolatopsis oliviviridis]|uniref:Uncharacterized protein n=1 Tax=Amycolatopsis oliviviridis TaxID=1471590 RepID=A0ABQ3M6N6_9PSEU|nr:hypothetical protein [Amycolatopsis oliviviridis]GHH28286.1 hypothetical protein GCM10017790_58870 [Amycolatopsis oliviviridis]